MGYIKTMNTLTQTKEFKNWLTGIKDPKAKAAITKRLERAKFGNFGDCKPVGDKVSEMRIDTGPGYRVYFVRDGDTVYVLLAGGTKRTQKKDIARAKELASLL